MVKRRTVRTDRKGNEMVKRRNKQSSRPALKGQPGGIVSRAQKRQGRSTEISTAKGNRSGKCFVLKAIEKLMVRECKK